MILIKKKRTKKLISIITVTKNSEKTLQRCILSVANQNFKNYEHIIIDGDSDDKTLEIIKKNSKFISYAISKKDKNLWEAMNRGIKLARGEIIGILNSDDIYYANALLTVQKYFKKKKIDCLFGAVKKKKNFP